MDEVDVDMIDRDVVVTKREGFDDVEMYLRDALSEFQHGKQVTDECYHLLV
jgi:hypothetical protein